MPSTSKHQVLQTAESIDYCMQCGKECSTYVSNAKGMLYMCSNSCQNNFLLQCGLKGYNQVRHTTDGIKFKTVGKLNELTAKELDRLYRFKNGLNKSQMNRAKDGDTLDSLLSSMRLGKKSPKVQTRMPFTWTGDMTAMK